MINYLKSPDSFLPPPCPAWPSAPKAQTVIFFIPIATPSRGRGREQQQGSGLRGACCVLVACGRDLCGCSQLCSLRSLGSIPEASTKLEMTFVATLSMAGDGAVGERTARAVGNQSIDGSSEYDMSPAKHALTPDRPGAGLAASPVCHGVGARQGTALLQRCPLWAVTEGVLHAVTALRGQFPGRDRRRS